MDANSLVTIIGSLGFPICACVGMAWYVKYQMDAYNKQVKDMREEHTAQIKSVTEAINNNTIVIQTLVDKLDNNCCIR